MLEKLKNANGRILIAAIAGAAAGIVAGLLIAPQPGASTRKRMAQGAFDVRDIMDKAFKKYLQQQQQARPGTR